MQAVPARFRVRTSDFDEAVSAMRATYGQVELQRDEDGRAGLTLQSAATADLVASRWSLSGIGGGRLDRPESDEPTVLTGVRLGGDIRIWSRWNDIDTSRPFLYPDVIDSALDTPTLAHVAISRSALDARACALTGIDDFSVRFTGTAPVDAAYDGIWRDTVVWVARTLEALADLPDTQLAQAGLVDAVAALMLRAFPNTTLDAAHRGDIGGPRTAGLRRATQFIDEHLDAPITVVEIAEAARLSARGVYAAFRRELELSPMEYLRRGRLGAARAELLGADPATDVAAVAVRWGFPQLGRFEELYREIYGESPVDTPLR